MRSLVGSTLAVLLLLSGCGGGSEPSPSESNQQAVRSAGLPTAASRVMDTTEARNFHSVGQLAATASLVVRGHVVDVVPGDPVTFPDGSGVAVTPRYLVVQVDEYLAARDADAPQPASLHVYDGYWQASEGYRRQEFDWAEPGDAGVFFLDQDTDANGQPLNTYSPLGAEGRVLLNPGEPVYDEDASSVWASVGEEPSVTELKEAVAEGVNSAENGDAKPLLVEVCRPSDPADEDSEPICTKE